MGMLIKDSSKICPEKLKQRLKEISKEPSGI